MRIIPFTISIIVTVVLIFVFNRPLGPLPMPLGKFVSPQHGFWQNAEPADAGFDEDLSFADLKGKAEVYFDERLVLEYALWQYVNPQINYAAVSGNILRSHNLSCAVPLH